MKKLYRFLLSFVCFFVLMLVTNVVDAALYRQDTSGNWYFDYASKLDSTYYESAEEATTAEELRTALHTIISTNTKKYTYDEVYTLLNTTDEDPNNSDNILCLLTGKSMSKTAHASSGKDGWNREHIWAKAFGFKFLEDGKTQDQSCAPWNDLHHLRAAEAYTNSTYHNDRNYGYVKDITDIKEDEYGNKYSNKLKLYEPRDCVKGDIARMILYMDIRYEGDEASEGYQLSLADFLTTASVAGSKLGEMGIVSTLLEWDAMDPVDDLELQRNDKVYELQGNRNPFIDHPEYANVLYGASYYVPKASEHRVHYYAENAAFDYIDLHYYESDTAINMPTIEPIYKERGYDFTGWYTDEACTTKFDFETMKIGEKELKLYAGFKYVGLAPEEAFDLESTMASLGIKYDAIGTKDRNPIMEKMTITPTQEGGAKSGISTNNTYTFDENLNYDKNLFKIEYLTNGKNAAYVGNNVIRLYASTKNGTTLLISGKEDSNVVITNITMETKVDGNLDIESNEVCSIQKAEDGSSIGIQNVIDATKNNLIYIYSITVEYYTSVPNLSYSVNYPIKLEFVAYLSKELYEGLTGYEAFDSFAFILNEESRECVEEELADGSYAFRLTLEINHENIQTLYEAQFAVKIGENTYYMKKISCSAQSLAKCYTMYYFDDDIVSNHMDILRIIGNQN